jgi:glutamate synthase (NADPH) large chain
MSGGIAYVYDPDGTFDTRVNYEMVEIEGLDAGDEQWLQETLSRHLAFTGSAVADRVLKAWTVELPLFRKVMPRDYKKVLTVIEAAHKDGLDEAETSHRIMEAARG